MKIIVIPGYFDRRDYIDRATRKWAKKYGLETDIYVFGWNGEAKSYDQKWQNFAAKLQQVDQTAIIGISAGTSVAIRALQTFPDKITKVITICGPVHANKMDPATLHDRFPVLEYSLANTNLENLPVERVMTIRPWYDGLVSIDAMFIKGARDKRLPMVGHRTSVVLTMFAYGRAMAEFITKSH